MERQNRQRRIGEDEIFQYARDRKFEETAIALSFMSDTPIDVVERALLDPGAEIVLILAKVAGLSATTTRALLLLRAADRGMSVSDLDQAMATFNRMHLDTARRVLSFFRTRITTPDATHHLSAGRRERLAARLQPRQVNKSNIPAALAAIPRSDSGNSNRPATSNIPWRSVVLPPR